MERVFNRLKNLGDFKRSLVKVSAEITSSYPGATISKIGHRVVHGGELNGPYLIKNKNDFKKLSKLSKLAPVHNPVALSVIQLAAKLFRGSLQLAVFDTSFYSDLPDISKHFPINQTLAADYKLRKYGFHGISHQYAANIVDPGHQKKIISIHLGAGCSITAIKNGQPIDTSMSLTPLDGLVMQTRSGSIDAGLVLFLAREFGINKTESMLNNNSGLAGMTGTDGDLRLLLYNAGYPVTDEEFLNNLPPAATELQKDKAIFAIDKYCYEIGKLAAAYNYALSGCDTIVFTGQAGNGSKFIRDKILTGTTLGSKNVITVEPNEELAIYNMIK
jgi:acetate kinase